jgi:hypothetical protein
MNMRSKMAMKMNDVSCTCKDVWCQYELGRQFNNQQDLEDKVRTNENFFIGRQWEGVESNGLPTPVFNFLKRVVLFIVAGITSDNLKLNASSLGSAPVDLTKKQLIDTVNKEFESLFELNKIVNLLRVYMRNAAVDGDGCTYSYWNPDIETGQKAKGAICTEIIENTRVFFGNPNDRRVQKQPYIIIQSREISEVLEHRAYAAGDIEEDTHITPDNDDINQDSRNYTDDKTTVLLKMWRDCETGTIWAVECTRDCIIREPWDMGISLYPVTWLNWDYCQDNYHGQAMISGLIPNQIFVNKLYAMSMISLMTTAYPKIVYDKNRIHKWDNRVGAAIPVVGGNVADVAKIIDPAQISPQIAQFIQMAIDHTQTFQGATNVALGDTRPDNTSAIIALQRAASTPSEITKQNLYETVEDLGRIYIEFMGENYGKREVEVTIPDEMAPLAAFIGKAPGQLLPAKIDFGQLKKMRLSTKLDVGASSYWSEIAAMQTLDNLLMQNKIDLIDYLERVPNGYITKREELIAKFTKLQQVAMQPQLGAAPGAPGAGGPMVATGAAPEVPGGQGYGALQRAINQTGVVQ